MIDYEKAARYWDDRLDEAGEMDMSELEDKAIEFVQEHNTLALALCAEDRPHVTPLEYFYYNGYFYIFTEGGKKFEYLDKNTRCAFTIYETYSGKAVKSLQSEGFVAVMDSSYPDYESVFAAKGLNPSDLAAKGVELHLLKITPLNFTYLDSSLKKDGYNSMQRGCWSVGLIIN